VAGKTSTKQEVPLSQSYVQKEVEAPLVEAKEPDEQTDPLDLYNSALRNLPIE